MAIADTIVPLIEVSSTPSVNALCIQASEYATAAEKLKERLPSEVNSELSHQYLHENASSIPGFRELLRRVIGDYVREDSRKGIRVVLSALK